MGSGGSITDGKITLTTKDGLASGISVKADDDYTFKWPDLDALRHSSIVKKDGEIVMVVDPPVLLDLKNEVVNLRVAVEGIESAIDRRGEDMKYTLNDVALAIRGSFSGSPSYPPPQPATVDTEALATVLSAMVSTVVEQVFERIEAAREVADAADGSF